MEDRGLIDTEQGSNKEDEETRHYELNTSSAVWEEAQ